MKKNLFFSLFFCCLSFYLSDSFANPNLGLVEDKVSEGMFVPAPKKTKQKFTINDFLKGHEGLLKKLLIKEEDLKKLSHEKLLGLYIDINAIFSNELKNYLIQPLDIIKIKPFMDHCRKLLVKIEEISENRKINSILKELNLDI